MPRFSRILSSDADADADAAAPPAAVNVQSDLMVILAALLCALLMRGGAYFGGSLCLHPPCYRGEGGGATTKFGSTECAICLGEFVEGDEVRALPQCGHSFHVVCIDTWLGSRSSCPSCRQILVVARCQKCSDFPASTSSASCGVELPLRLS
ncbi:RING-H2 finger protein ATL80-like [Populus alba x Populus x berolinensis]|nr:RING-H2 finger protein ATL80-like [Populus alba x Populus x berolinensis]